MIHQKGLSKSEQAKLDQDIQEYKASLLKQKENYMEAHKTKMAALTQELEELQLQLQTLGPQKLRGSTASLTTSSMAAEDTVENISGSSEMEEENETKDTSSQHQEEDSPSQHQEEDSPSQHEVKDNDPEVTDELTT